jgi:hypothetical protein
MDTPQGHRADAFGNICYNCGAPDHTSDKCPLPRDDLRSQRPKRRAQSQLLKDAVLVVVVVDADAVMVVVAVGVTVPMLGESGVPIKVILLLPVQIHLWVMESSKLCGWNATHTSRFHGKWNQNQSTFCIPATHVFWGKSGTTSSAEKGPAPTAGTASSGVSRG